ncbi:MAG: acyl-CoA synthetase [Anaerolineae bacterium]
MPGFETFAEIETFEQTPFADRRLPPNTFELIRQGSADDPDRPALIFFLDPNQYDKAVTVTYRQLLARITQTANLLHEIGIGPNDVVALLMPNLPETFFAILGGELAGIVSPINPMLDVPTIADIMNAAGAKALIALGPFPGTDLWDKAEAVRPHVPTLKTIIRVDLLAYLGRHGPPDIPDDGSDQRILDFHASVAPQPDDNLVSGRDVQPDDVCAYFHTGGTTGTPKLAVHTHAMEVADAWMSAECIGTEGSQVYLCGLPLFHVNAVVVTGLIPWGRGSTVVLATPQGYRHMGLLMSFWKVIEHYKVNFFSAVPTVYAGLLQVPIGERDVSSLHYAICGAAPMPVEVFTEFQRRTGVRILEGYGLTEGTCVSSVNPMNGEKRVGSIGFRLPYQAMKAVVLDNQNGYERDCGPDEIGTVIIRGPNVFPGYTDESYNRSIWVDTGDGGGPWFNTGDLARVDPDGYFWLTGRRKELIIRGGHNIDPKSIEDPLHKHPAVALAAAVGRPDARLGEVPVAYVELRSGAIVTEQDLLTFAQEHIGERAAVPKTIRVIDHMPVTAVGKIFKPQLIWREAETVYHDEIAPQPGVHAVTVQVGPDKVYGMVADIHVTAAPGVEMEELEARVREALGLYTIRYNLTVA